MDREDHVNIGRLSFDFFLWLHAVSIVCESWPGESCSKSSNFSNQKHLHAAIFALELNFSVVLLRIVLTNSMLGKIVRVWHRDHGKVVNCLFNLC